MSVALSYSEKLKDPRWQKKRLEILERDGWKCLECGNTTETLHVHHLFYEPNEPPWATPDYGLRTLCESCHEFASRLTVKADGGIDQFCSSALVLMDVLRAKGLHSGDVLSFAYSLSDVPAQDFQDWKWRVSPPDPSPEELEKIRKA